MLRGESQLGPLRVDWSVPEDAIGAAGGLEHLAPARAPSNARWRLERGEPGTPPDAYAAFFGPVRVRFDRDAVHVWSPTAELVVEPASVRGVVAGAATLPAQLGLHALALHAGLVHLHAAMVRLGARTILAAAGSGGGKTSLALAVARSGGELLADDVVYLADDRVAWPVRRPPHVCDATLAAHPGLEVLGPVQDGALPKVRVRAPEAGPAAPARVDAVVVPTIDRAAATHVRPMRAAELFPLLVGSAALTPVEGAPRREEALDRIADLATVPAAVLVAGPDALEDPTRIPRALRAWLER